MTNTTTKPEQSVQTLTAEEYEHQPEQQSEREIVTPDWEATMEAIAKPNTRLTIPRNKDFNRKQVVTAFSSAFELIGGVQRLALWAHQNQDDFYKLYARLLPSQASSALGESNELVIKHVLPKGALDQ